MPSNTVYGPFAPTTMVNGVSALNATWGNAIQTQASIALHGFNGDLLTPFVLSGCVCTMDAGNHKQLDVTAGSVYIKMTDGTVGLIATIASVTNQFLTSTPSTTYFLDINPDGTWSFATSHSGVTNHLTICSLTTDGSGNILVITDARTLTTTLFSAAGGFGVGTGAYMFGPSNAAALRYSAANHEIEFQTLLSGVANGTLFIGWNGAGAVFPLSVGTTGVGGATVINNSGAITQLATQATAGDYGVPLVTAITKQQAITSTTNTTICTLTVPVGSTRWVRCAMMFWIGAGNTNNGTITTTINCTDPISGAISTNFAQYFGATSVGPASALTKGARIRCMDMTMEVTSGSTITLQYQNAAAGTIADHVTASIELLA